VINRCAILLKQELTHRFKQAGYDITPEEWAILNRLWAKDGMSQNDLAERTVKDKTTITRFLVQMEKKGLIKRNSSKTDGRAKNVHITSKGQQLKPVLISIAMGLLAKAGTGISQQDFQITFNSLETIEKNLLSIENPE